jgi:hypothetical protein
MQSGNEEWAIDVVQRQVIGGGSANEMMHKEFMGAQTSPSVRVPHDMEGLAMLWKAVERACDSCTNGGGELERVGD